MTESEVDFTLCFLCIFGEKAAWLKNRVIVRAIETALLLGLVLLPVVHLKWRFIAALAVFIGTITNGFRMKDGSYENICPYFIEL